MTPKGFGKAVDTSQTSAEAFSLTYCMNQLQHVSEDVFGPVLVTLNASPEPRPELIVGRYDYQHPIMDLAALSARDKMSEIQNARGLSFAGAYLGHGFHEDGFRSGLQAAKALGAALPFNIQSPDRDYGSMLPAIVFENFHELCLMLVRLIAWIVFKLCG